MISASLKNYRQSPRKVRSVANLVCGKTVAEALNMLAFLPKKATDPLAGLLRSAVANAKNNFNIDGDNLFIKELRVDSGIVLKRSMPVSRGSAHPIHKRSSNVLVTLAPLSEKPVKMRRWARAATAKLVATKSNVGKSVVAASPLKTTTTATKK
jgi:large subunit ribosomal protein L22